MSSNQSLLQKADLAIADIQAGGAELPPTQAANFIRKMILAPSILNLARVIEMVGPKRNVNKIGFGQRILRKAVSATALTQSQRSKPQFEQLQLDTDEQIAEIWIPYDVMEDNLERATAANNEPSNTGPGGLRQTILDLIAERSAADLEELGLLADTDYTNGADQDDEDYMSQMDGWLKLGLEDGNVYDVDGATISKTVFKMGQKTLPKQYLRNRASMRNFVSYNNEIEYRDQLSNRATSLGDANTVGLQDVYAFGSPVVPVGRMPEDKGIYTDPLNLLFGIQRQISLEFDKNISARVYIIVLTCRIAFQIEEPEALVVYENIAD